MNFKQKLKDAILSGTETRYINYKDRDEEYWVQVDENKWKQLIKELN